MNAHGTKYGPLCIEGKNAHFSGCKIILDPLNTTNDVGRSTFQWKHVQACFDHCCRKLKKALEEQPDPAMRGGTLIGHILGVPDDLLLYRYLLFLKTTPIERFFQDAGAIRPSIPTIY